MISPSFPWPLNTGGKIRIYQILRHLIRLGHKVTFLSLAQETYSSEVVEELETLCEKFLIIPSPRQSKVWAALRSIIFYEPYRLAKFENREFTEKIAHEFSHDYDLVWVNFLETLASLPSEHEVQKKPIIVLDQQNADELFWMTYAQHGPFWIRFFAKQNLKRVRRLQARVIHKVDIILSVSKEDADFTQASLADSSIEVWVAPNGVDTEKMYPAENQERRNKIIFCGSMDVMMNIEAVEWFTHNVFKKVREEVPDAEFWIVGRNPGPGVQKLSSVSGVYVTGSVPDVRPFYAEAKVAVAPLRLGGGTKLKVLEAMALGVPVVATPIGSQGIKAVPGKHLFVEESIENFAQKVVSLLQNEEIARKMAQEARRLVEEHYSWSGVWGQIALRLEQYKEAREKQR
ncbi:MAG: glycosyltransferase [Candidatus Aminicenantes bacterium]|nr:glycosyltransferase [Candidatus Aminicenantes bacterium]